MHPQGGAGELYQKHFGLQYLCDSGIVAGIQRSTTLASRLEVEITECLWAKTFREADGAEIGYATICHPDYVVCQAFNPKIRMIRSKTLIQGDDCCNHRWVWEG